MPTLCLRLLLMLSLVLNAVAAPWANAHQHGGTLSDAARAATGDEYHRHGHAAHHPAPRESAVDHGTHADPADAFAASSEAGEQAREGDCCGSAACRCGCLLPLVLPLVPLGLAAMPPPPGRAMPYATAPDALPTVPPFRPPSA